MTLRRDEVPPSPITEEETTSAPQTDRQRSRWQACAQSRAREHRFGFFFYYKCLNVVWLVENIYTTKKQKKEKVWKDVGPIPGLCEDLGPLNGLVLDLVLQQTGFNPG